MPAHPVDVHDDSDYFADISATGESDSEELDYYERAVAADPTCRDAQCSLGCAHARARRYDAALACFRAILEKIDPADAEAMQMARKVAVLAHQNTGAATSG